MSRPAYTWDGIVIKIIRRYPELRRMRDETQGVRLTASYSGMPSAGSARRTTEDTALRQLTQADQRDLDAVERTIEHFRNVQDGDIAIKVVELVDFKRTHTVAGAAAACHVSESTAKRKRRQFIRLAAKKLEYL